MVTAVRVTQYGCDASGRRLCVFVIMCLCLCVLVMGVGRGWWIFGPNTQHIFPLVAITYWALFERSETQVRSAKRK